MFYVKSVRRYNALCRRYKSTNQKQTADYYLVLDGSNKIHWGSGPSRLTHEELAEILALVPESEHLYITTGGYS